MTAVRKLYFWLELFIIVKNNLDVNAYFLFTLMHLLAVNHSLVIVRTILPRDSTIDENLHERD